MRFLQNSTFMKYLYKRNAPVASFRSGKGVTYIPETRLFLNGSRFRMPAFQDAVQTGRMQPT